MKVLGIVGSLRAESLNAQLMDSVAVPDGVELEVFSGLGAIGPFDDGEKLAPVRALEDAIVGADAVLFATPEYNGSIPGVLKNALDWVSVPFDENVLRNKPVAVIGASTSMFGGVWAQAELRKVLGLIGARVVEGDLSDLVQRALKRPPERIAA